MSVGNPVAMGNSTGGECRPILSPYNDDSWTAMRLPRRLGGATLWRPAPIALLAMGAERVSAL